jgi:protease IV
MKKSFAVLAVISAIVLSLAFLAGLSSRWDSSASVLAGSAVGLLRVEGEIFDAEETIRQIHKFRDNDRVKAVVLRIDSPGGAIAPSQEIYEEIGKLAEDKPVVASMGTVAASGGYYIACPSDWIVANPGTITGSIGVIARFTNWEGLMGKIGIREKAITSGAFKDTGSPFREMTPGEEALMRDLIMDSYAQFKEAVLSSRSLDRAAIEPYLDGRVFTGRQALGLKLVDELGDLQDAIAKAAELGGISDRPPKVVEPEVDEGGGLFRLLTGQTPAQLVGSITGIGTGKASREYMLWKAF